MTGSIGNHVNVRRIRVVVGIAFAVCVSSALPLHAQPRGWNSVSSGSDDELYVRALQLFGALPNATWSSRPLSNRTLDSARVSLDGVHPWQSRFAKDAGAKTFNWRGVTVDGSANSKFPWGGNDGARWQGKGVNAALSSGFLVRWKGLTARAEPIAIYSQNADFDVLPTLGGDSVSPYVDRMRPRTIDLYDRPGNVALKRIEAGESELRLESHGFAAAISNRALFLGPAVRNPLILGNNGPGFAHVSAGTTDGIRTPIGKLSGTLIYARLAQSSWAPDLREGSRIAAGTVVSWRPPSGKGVELGLIRFYHRDWPSDGIKPGDLLLPFGTLLGDREVAGLSPPDNQLLSLFARAVSVSAGLEVFGEFSRNDRSSGGRDLLVEPEHNSAWSAGLLKVAGKRESGKFWTTRVEYLNGRITSLQRFRPQASTYEHFTITQGHTNRGQLLGSPLLERTGGFEVAVDRWSHRGRIGGMIQQRAMPLLGEEGVPAGAARSQWALELNGSYFTRLAEYGWRAGTAWDLNRTPGVDLSNVFLGASLRFGR